MSLSEDLLEQAEILATLDLRRPKQASLRRAISAAYYALFHSLIDDACGLAIGSQHDRRGFRNALARGFDHGSMKEACASFGGGTLKSTVARHLPSGFVIPSEVSDLAQHFVALQEMRHKADYDRTERFVRSDTQTALGNTRVLLAAFRSLVNSREKDFFLASLYSWKDMARR